eukprot:GHVP01067394.1.p2 GENE.GHVP01067394.1~~GHVP01067394.1.p2  ORF type:complete len:124 (+),score=24.02 GHVP01067394.1:726-1097(+)
MDALSREKMKFVLAWDNSSDYPDLNLDVEKLNCQEEDPLQIRCKPERFTLKDTREGHSFVVLRNITKKTQQIYCFVEKTDFLYQVPKGSEDFKRILSKIPNPVNNLKRPSSKPSNSVPGKISK